MTQVVAITGAAGGLGRCLAETYGKAGWSMVLGDIDAEQLHTTVEALKKQGVQVSGFACDVRRDEDVQTLVSAAYQTYGHLDCMINNAGVATAGAIDALSLDDWRWVLDINLMGVVRGCHAVAQRFKQQGHGQIINIASLAGLMTLPGMSAYNASKAAVVSLTETLHAELAPYGIHVSVVCPSFFKTGLGNSMRSTDPGMKKFLDHLMTSSLLSAEDIAEFTYRESQRERLHILPHRQGRRWWWLKRLLPGVYFNIMRKAAEKAKQREQPRRQEA
ncbi:MAG: SDR family oxidoreductase [Pseudomonadales bacterium]|nr:SDR family oxidoreductase [Pseudomonadales bacterium]